MSQLFDNYIKGNIHIPDNTSSFLHTNPEYKDVINIGATNNHVLEISPAKDEIKEIEITYKQGTEIILVKTFDMSLFYKALDEREEETEAGEWLYPNEDTTLYVLSDEELENQYQHAKEHDCFRLYRSILSYTLSAGESGLFNEYNKDLTAQARITYVDGHTDFSDLYKLIPIYNILNVLKENE